ncbi:MAG: zinc-ribbon domain-containing protein [Oscillospiraceae bacterium]|nr:zinc-ribbon domain-containing protein [Oscillospiraceae bacterium]
MICTKCGAQIPEGTRFCSKCGTPAPVSAPQPAPQYAPQSTPQYAPQYAPQTPGQPAPQPRRRPSARAKQRKMMVMITMGICLLLIVLSVVSTLTKPFYKIPALSTILLIGGVQNEVETELLDEMDYEIERIEDSLDYYEDFMEDDEVEAAEKYLDSMQKLRSKFSVLNLKSFVGVAEEVNKDYDLGLDASDFDEINLVMNILIIAVIVFFILPVVFILLGGLKRSFGLTIAGIVLTALSQMMLSGFLWVLLSLAAGIYMAMLCKRPKRRPPVPAAPAV